MNERIRELAKAYLVHERYTRYGEIVEEDLYEFYPDELEKFALLIVQECASKVTRNEALNILEHFGVEE
jgi:hypothetical protein